MRFPFRPIAAARVVGLVVVVAALGACTAHDGAGLVSGGTPAPTAVPEQFLKSSYCPPVQIRADTEAMTIYERGHDNETGFVRQQASITKTARECHTNGSTLTIKLGITGRVVAGPKGGAGTVTLPIRVAVVKQVGGNGPLFSNLYKVPVTVSAPTYSAGYEHVFDQISVQIGPQDRNLIIFVGFDEGKK